MEEQAESFTTNTNWQSYGGESTMSYLSQMAALAWHNFTSAVAGIGVALALARGLTRRLPPDADLGLVVLGIAYNVPGARHDRPAARSDPTDRSDRARPSSARPTSRAGRAPS